MDDDDNDELHLDPSLVNEEALGNLSLDQHLPYNALKGSSGLGIMNFSGTINGMAVQILLDSGSSNNFLQPRIAKCLKLPIEPAPNFQVLVGNRHSLVVEGLVKQLEVMVQGYPFQLPVYLH